MGRVRSQAQCHEAPGAGTVPSVRAAARHAARGQAAGAKPSFGGGLRLGACTRIVMAGTLRRMAAPTAAHPTRPQARFQPLPRSSKLRTFHFVGPYLILIIFFGIPCFSDSRYTCSSNLLLISGLRASMLATGSWR